MNANVRGIWMIVECPHCLKPQILYKHVLDNKVVNIMKPRYFDCEFCGNNCFIHLEEMETEMPYTFKEALAEKK
jgi:ribosomal protein S27E